MTTSYAVHTQPQKESLANFMLFHQGIKTLWLHYETTVTHARKVKDVTRSYFPRYLFVMLTPGQSVGQINTTVGVSGVVCSAGVPVEVPEGVIEELRARGDATGLVSMSPEEKHRRQAFKRGQEVRINDGSMEGFMAIVDIDKGHEVGVWLNLFRGQVRADFHPESLSPAGRSLS